MKQPIDRFQYLFEQFVHKRSSPDEVNELFELLKRPGNEKAGLELLDLYFAGPVNENEFDRSYGLKPLQEIKQGGRLRLPVVRRWWLSAAAVVLVAAGISYLRLHRPAEKSDTIAVRAANDLLPPTATHAILTLANGKKLALDSMASGVLVQQGATRITKLKDGRITYAGADKAGELEYNKLEVPKGSRIASLILDDGTRVWLNSGSSLKYPVAFTGQDRKVEITGEAYFEVAKAAGKTFVVSGGGITTEVLGTHFNVNVYEDERDRRVTLLEGSIRVNKGDKGDILKPGEQVRISPVGHMSLLSEVNLDEVIAWKNAMFIMEKSDIVMIMRQISRWYNVEVVYSGGIPNGELSGDINRDMELSKVLKVLELSGVHFKMEGRKVIVSP